MPMNLLPPFSVGSMPSHSAQTPSFTTSGMHRSPLTVTSALPTVVPAYYLPTAHSNTSDRDRPLPTIPMGTPLFMPQMQGSFSMQPFSYMPGIFCQPLVMPPVVFQPASVDPNDAPSTSHSPGQTFSRTSQRHRHPYHTRRHHQSHRTDLAPRTSASRYANNAERHLSPSKDPHSGNRRRANPVREIVS